jgi:hypothetical protein
VCWVDLCEIVVDMHIMKNHPNDWEFQKTITFRQILRGSCKGLVVVCKTCELINGEWKCVVFFVLSI